MISRNLFLGECFMKNKIFFGGLLLLSYAGAQAEYSYSDSFKIKHRAALQTESIINHRKRMYSPEYLNAVSPLLVAIHELVPSDTLEKINRYNGWYNNDTCSISWPEIAAITQIVEPIVFLGADYVVEKGADLMSQTEVAQSIKQAIPTEYYTFAAENGKFVLAAGGARFIGGIAKGRSVSTTAKVVGKNACVHLGFNVLEEYVINPKIDQYMGPENSTTKKCVKFAANGAAQMILIKGLVMLSN
jgi:hypothetical protein